MVGKMKNSQNCTRVDIFRLSSAQINHNISEIQPVGLEIETKKQKKIELLQNVVISCIKEY